MTPSMVEEYMREVESTLNDMQLDAARPPLRTEGVDPCMRSFIHDVSRMSRAVRAHQPAAASAATMGYLNKRTYHALVMCFLAARAEHAHPGDNLDEAKRITWLTQVLKEHSPSWLPLPYTVRGLYSSELSPVTLVTHNSTLYVAGRGSKSPPEFVADCRMNLEGIGGTANVLHGVGKAHKGILNAFAMQVKGVLGLIDQLVDQGFDGEQGRVEEVVFCGHSLGGALAQLLGLAYAQRKSRVANCLRRVSARVVSFGSPRLGDRELTGLLDEYTFHERLYVHKDPIAGVPSPSNKEFRNIFPVVQLYAPHHANRSWALGADRVAETSSPDEPLVGSVFGWMCRGGRRNHRLTMYASSLKYDLSQKGSGAGTHTAAV